MSTPDRGATRTAIAAGLRANVPSAATVLAYQANDFSGLSPTIVVTSAASERERATMQGSVAIFVYHLHVFVAFAADGEVGYTDSDAEDLIDQVEREIAQFVDRTQRTAEWHALAYSRASDAGTPASIGGIEYRHEVIALAVSVSS
jgi:hypothetical protein